MFLKSYWPGVILFCAFLVAGLVNYQDYGLSWDELEQRDMGLVSYNYVFESDTTLSSHYYGRQHGPGFELGLLFIEKEMGIEDTRDIFLMRHLVTHIFFLIGALCGYILAFRLFKNQFLACLFFFVLVCTPRFYAHSYFNTKDIPFLATYLMAMLAIAAGFEKRNRYIFLVAGILAGFATSIRILGFLLPLMVCMFLCIDAFIAYRNKNKLQPLLVTALFFIVGYIVTLYTWFPYLWDAPVARFIETYQRLAYYGWGGSVLLNGTVFSALKLPPYYFPVWFSVTVPLLWLFPGVLGIILVIKSIIVSPGKYLSNTPERNFLIFLLTFVVPIYGVIAKGSVMYDDWRHLYFIYPSFIMLALFAINKISTGRFKIAVYALCVVQLGLVGYFMIRNHPFQQVYFNELVSREKEYLRHHYDLDYWGASNKQGLEYILANDPSPQIKIAHSGWTLPATYNVSLLTPEQRKRIVMVDETDSFDYFLTNFRNHPDDHDFYKTVYEIKVLNSTILRVYKTHD